MIASNKSGLKSPRSASKQDALQFVRFVAVGGVAAAVNFGSRFIYSTVVPFEVAVVGAYFTAAAVGFSLFRIFVFPGNTRPIREQTFAFLLVSLAGMAQTWGISVLLVRLIWPAIDFSGPREATAHVIGICVPIITSYLGHKRLTFRGG